MVFSFGLEGQRHLRHVRDAFHGDGDLDGLGNRLSPGEGGVTVDEHGGKIGGIQFVAEEALDDDVAGGPFVFAAGDFLYGHLPGDGNVAVEIVGVRRAEDRDLAAGLGEGRGVRAVRVDHTADGREGEEEPAVRGRVGGRVELPLDPLPVEVDEDHVGGLEVGVSDPARLDGEDALGAVDGAGVAEGEVDQPVLRQGEVGLVGLAFEFS